MANTKTNLMNLSDIDNTWIWQDDMITFPEHNEYDTIIDGEPLSEETQRLYDEAVQHLIDDLKESGF